MSDGRTALLLAAENNQRGTVEKILSCNLNENFVDRSGFDYDVAKQYQKNRG